MDEQRKDDLDLEGPPKKEPPSYDVENTNGRS